VYFQVCKWESEWAGVAVAQHEAFARTLWCVASVLKILFVVMNSIVVIEWVEFAINFILFM
jgi:hypothetical protein